MCMQATYECLCVNAVGFIQEKNPAHLGQKIIMGLYDANLLALIIIDGT